MNNTPTGAPPREPKISPDAHGQPVCTGMGGERPLPPITEFPMMVEKQAPEGEEDKYVVDVETHVSVLVQATSPEAAAAKAVLHMVDAEEDGSVTEVGRDVHTCVHSGLDESENCDQHGEHNEE